MWIFKGKFLVAQRGDTAGETVDTTLGITSKDTANVGVVLLNQPGDECIAASVVIGADLWDLR